MSRPSSSNPTSVLLLLLVVSVLLWWIGVLHWGAEKFSSSVTALGILVGGSWTLYQFVLRRAFESALSIDYVLRTEHAGMTAKNCAAFLDVVLENIGNRRITALGKLSQDQINVRFQHRANGKIRLHRGHLSADFHRRPHVERKWNREAIGNY